MSFDRQWIYKQEAENEAKTETIWLQSPTKYFVKNSKF